MHASGVDEGFSMSYYLLICGAIGVRRSTFGKLCVWLLEADALQHDKGFIQSCKGVITGNKRTSEQSRLGFIHIPPGVEMERSEGLHGTSQLSIPTQKMLTKPCL
jgi:hypothetical protein